MYLNVKYAINTVVVINVGGFTSSIFIGTLE